MELNQSKLADDSTEPKGFTLIELLVVISIIALLIAIMLPALAKARQNARMMDCLSRQRQLGIVHQIHVDEHQGYLIVSTAGGNRWSWYLSYRYPDGTHAPKTSTAPVSGSMLVCPEDAEPFGAPPPNDYPMYKIELGGSYALNWDDCARGPNGLWSKYGARASWDAQDDVSWRSERMDAIRVPSEHLLLWDTNNDRINGAAPTPEYRFFRDDYTTRLPDPLRHGGAGNLLFLDGHAKAVPAIASSIERRWVTWDHSD
jgi:prepilin-type N-terminal cleavage/methylation domain-containing protein/prepilin-type processing-associated H-X9-DG protein